MIMIADFFNELDKEIKTDFKSESLEDTIKKVIAENSMKLELDDTFKMYKKDNVLIITTQ